MYTFQPNSVQNFGLAFQRLWFNVSYLRRQTMPQQIISKQRASPVKPTATTAATTANTMSWWTLQSIGWFQTEMYSVLMRIINWYTKIHWDDNECV